MRGQIRKRGKSWAVIIYLGRDPQTGKKRRKWYTHRTQREAEAHLNQLLVQMQAGAGVPPSRLLVRDYFSQWLLDDVAGRLAPTTEAIYAYGIRRHLIPALGHMPLSRLSAPALQSCLNNMLSRGLSAATVHQVYRTAHAALGTAVHWGLLLRNPCAYVKPPHVDRRDATIWDEEQVRLFLVEARRSSAHYRLYLTILLGGLRPGEALALRWDDVNLVLGMITIRQKFYRMGAKQLWGATKTHRQYAVSIPRPLVDELRTLQKEQAAQRRQWNGSCEDRGLVFCQFSGRPLHERNIARRDFCRVAKRAGLRRIRLYDLRHCNATHLADQGTPIHVVQRRLGHSSPSTTLRYYTHVLPDTERAAVDRLAERLLGSGNGSGDSRG